MKKIFSLFITIFVIMGVAGAQGRDNKPVLHEVSDLQVIQSIFPSATGVDNINGIWFKIVDANKKLLGYTLSSKKFSEGIKGYHNTTPVIIVMDTQKTIKKVALLSNWETAGFIKKLERQNYFNTWNGLKVNEALKQKAGVDSYTGATISANAINKNIEIILKKALDNNI